MTRVKKRRIKNLKKLSLKAIDAVDSSRQENMEEKTMKYYLTQAGKEFINEVLTQAQIDKIQKDVGITPKQKADAHKTELAKLNAHRKKLGLKPHVDK